MVVSGGMMTEKRLPLSPSPSPGEHYHATLRIGGLNVNITHTRAEPYNSKLAVSLSHYQAPHSPVGTAIHIYTHLLGTPSSWLKPTSQAAGLALLSAFVEVQEHRSQVTAVRWMDKRITPFIFSHLTAGASVHSSNRYGLDNITFGGAPPQRRIQCVRWLVILFGREIVLHNLQSSEVWVRRKFPQFSTAGGLIAGEFSGGAMATTICWVFRGTRT